MNMTEEEGARAQNQSAALRTKWDIFFHFIGNRMIKFRFGAGSRE